jgi:hypothetical protein
MRGSRGSGRLGPLFSDVSCLVCRRRISRYTDTCPHCRAPQPAKRLGSTLGLGILVLMMAALAVLTIMN